MIPYRSAKMVDGLREYYVGHSHNTPSCVLCTWKTPQTTDNSSGTCMRIYSCFTLLVCLNWSWQTKRVWCKLLVLRTVNCRPTTFHKYNGITKDGKLLQQQSKYICILKVPITNSYRIPAIRTYSGFSQSHNANAEIFPNKNHGRTLLYFPPTIVFPSHSMLYNNFSWNKDITGSKNQSNGININQQPYRMKKTEMNR